ncbi:ASI1-immunoprecipitated protein 3-like isoform X1 [Bidens hawaiensis]|uniref:ASI1-immunoprecipitated protein 3-like isoform X1 n=1 Tax=Bidens hawaiensis TaxID=980011 RepID=UPI00404AA307
MAEITDGYTPSIPSGHSSGSPPPPTPLRVGLIEYEDDEEEEDGVGNGVKPIGNAVKVSCIGGSKRYHFNGFEARGVCYQLEDTVLVVPDDPYVNMKPSVAIIKDITATQDGRITVTGQRFYRLDVAVNENGEKWESSDSRELFYSFDKTEFPASAVMHKCRVNFIPPNKEIPRAKHQPGFIVRKVYDSKYKELSELVDTCYDDSKQHELNLLLAKTIATVAKESLKL